MHFIALAKSPRDTVTGGCVTCCSWLCPLCHVGNNIALPVHVKLDNGDQSDQQQAPQVNTTNGPYSTKAGGSAKPGAGPSNDDLSTDNDLGFNQTKTSQPTADMYNEKTKLTQGPSQL